MNLPARPIRSAAQAPYATARRALGLAIAALLLPTAAGAAEAGAGSADATVAGDREPTQLQKLDVVAQREDGYTVSPSATGTGLVLSPLETPQSVSSIGREQMDDFGLRNANDVLALATGINVEKIETDRTYYSARGFDVVNFQVDGLGLPFTNGGAEGDLDTAMYERVEVLRGANGLLSSTGNPSATINFVRKRPTEDLQGSAGVTVGSWDTRRLDADLSGKLNRSGSVRGRVVAAGQDGDSYLDRYALKKHSIYGIVEADLGDSTLLSVGASYQKNEPHGGMWGALPLYYSDGSATDYARSTSTSTEWSYWNSTDKRAFVELQQALGGGWQLKAALNYRKLDSDGNLFYAYGTPDRATGLGLYSYPSRYVSHETQKYADLYASGPFVLGGREHELVAGVKWAGIDVSQVSTYADSSDTSAWFALPSLESWTGDIALPAFTTAPTGAEFDMIRRSAYATARWNLSDALKLITGVNHTRIESRGQNYGVQHAYDDSKTTPFVGAVYTFDPNYALYASYAEIFNPQTELDRNLQVLAPITGSNAELGIKGQWLQQRVNASFALFRAKQDNTAEADTYVGTLQTYKPVDATSTGYEFDVAGRIGTQWQLNAGYTQLGIKGDDGRNVRTYVPRRTFKLATTYTVPQWEALKLGATLTWQDAIVRDQQAVDTAGNAIYTRQGSYALLGLMAQYAITPRLNATLNVYNVTDRKYINSLYWAQGYYGAPRNTALSLTYRF
ncbi:MULTISPECIES: TonB-dependent siderophore receptor [unclassified Xanthomonas]|uniref:TonB-dependent siderophore receptor n=1 Tax=Xanthomonas sp. LMG 8992 TaxID=1591157 RepID=UPI0017DB871A|nr:TonB-dependent siderophore receptor [Xanthomonas sp. LMG 8992]